MILYNCSARMNQEHTHTCACTNTHTRSFPSNESTGIQRHNTDFSFRRMHGKADVGCFPAKSKPCFLAISSVVLLFLFLLLNYLPYYSSS